MGNWLNILPMFLLVLGAMIFVHELGHFLVAKWLGIRVEIFSLGFGKRLIGFKRGNTDYRVSLLPLGGYVKMAGDNIAEDREGAPDEFLSHSKWHRFLVAVAGPAMNILTAFAIPLVASMIYFQVPAYKSQPAVVSSVKPKSAAAQAGLESGDRVVKFNDTVTTTWRDLDDLVLLNPAHTVNFTVERHGQELSIPVELESVDVGGEKIGFLGAMPNLPGASVVVKSIDPAGQAAAAGVHLGDTIEAINGNPVGADLYGLIRMINENPNQSLTVTVSRNGQTLDIAATPKLDEGVGRLGFGPDWANVPMDTKPKSFPAAVAHAWDTNIRFVRLTGAAFGQIFKGERSAGSALSGPIGIAEIVGQAAEQGWEEVLGLMGLLSLNLGVFNLLPIPVLDGGLIFMLALEAVLGWFGRSLSLSMKEKMINVGLVLIVLLMGFVIFNDIRKHVIGPSTEEAPPPAQSAPPPAK